MVEAPGGRPAAGRAPTPAPFRGRTSGLSSPWLGAGGGGRSALMVLFLRRSTVSMEISKGSQLKTACGEVRQVLPGLVDGDDPRRAV